MEVSIYEVMLKERPDVLKVRQVSEILGVSRKTVYALINRGIIRAIKVGRAFCVPRIYFVDFLCEKGTDKGE